MSVLDQMMAKAEAEDKGGQVRSVDVVNTVRRLATNPDLKKFIQAVNRYSKADWAKLKETFSVAYHTFQSSMLVKNDSALANELKKYPWLVVLFERIENE